MPFISKDWRSPGEEWVKTEVGWEKKKVLECAGGLKQLDDSCSESPEFKNCDENIEKKNEGETGLPPHCYITIKPTREIAGFNGLSDALKRLDFKSAVHDSRRFKYICKLLDLLMAETLLSNLSGCSQKVFFTVLEEVARLVSTRQENIQVLRGLLEQLKEVVECACWGRPLGSTKLWEAHLRTIDRITSIASCIRITQNECNPSLEDLPEECIRGILLRLGDHKDLESCQNSCPIMADIVSENRLWKELSYFHFTHSQIEAILKHQPNLPWRQIFHKLRKKHGLKEDYAEMIELCRNCRCLFWSSFGHPCIADDPEFRQKLIDVDKSSLHVPIPPQTFLKFFSL